MITNSIDFSSKNSDFNCDVCFGKDNVDLHKNSCYNFRDDRKEIGMSLVGIFKTKDGLVAFGDSKPSIYINPERKNCSLIAYDEKRGSIPKVFSNNTLVVVTYGPNVIRDENIEDVIVKMLDAKDVYSFALSFHKYLIKKDIFAYNILYNFAIGEIIDGRQEIFSISVSSSELRIKKVNYPSFFAGCGDYFSELECLDFSILTSNFAINRLDKILNDAIERIDEYVKDYKGYNSVGKPIIFKVLPINN